MTDNTQMFINQVEEHANTAWLALATNIVKQLASVGEPFTTDEVWSRLGPIPVTTHEPRALGAVMRNLASTGFIRKTGQYVNTTRREAHSRPIPQWIGA